MDFLNLLPTCPNNFGPSNSITRLGNLTNFCPCQSASNKHVLISYTSHFQQGNCSICPNSFIFQTSQSLSVRQYANINVHSLTWKSLQGENLAPTSRVNIPATLREGGPVICIHSGHFTNSYTCCFISQETNSCVAREDSQNALQSTVHLCFHGCRH